jgi:transcriptional regulator with XRE-family HTH domain
MNPQINRATVGARIADARETKGLSQRGLAQRLGVTPATIERWESGVSDPRANRIAMLAGVLDVSLAWLLEGASRHEPDATRGSRVDAVAQKLERVVRMQEELGRLVSEIATEVAEIRRIEAELEELAA